MNTQVRSVFIGFDPHQFAGRRARPVSTRTGLSYDDYASMHTTHTQFHLRRKPTPEWALDDDLLREVVVAFMEARGCFAESTGRWQGTLMERLTRADVRLRNQVPLLNALIDRYSREYIETIDPERKRHLEIQIESRDTMVRIVERLAALVTSIAYLYHRVKMNSVGVAEELGVKPPHVRQVLYRLDQIAAKVRARDEARWEKLKAGNQARALRFRKEDV
jgi:hypothetical protein